MSTKVNEGEKHQNQILQIVLDAKSGKTSEIENTAFVGYLNFIVKNKNGQFFFFFLFFYGFYVLHETGPF